LGYRQARKQKGSHITFENPDREQGKTVVVPNHPSKEIKRGTLESIIKQAALTDLEIQKYIYEVTFKDQTGATVTAPREIPPEPEIAPVNPLDPVDQALEQDLTIFRTLLSSIDELTYYSKTAEQSISSEIKAKMKLFRDNGHEELAENLGASYRFKMTCIATCEGMDKVVSDFKRKVKTGNAKCSGQA
jgi:predicted RNA binding protein YcfA (HicA-like mRNA interferase family)